MVPSLQNYCITIKIYCYILISSKTTSIRNLTFENIIYHYAVKFCFISYQGRGRGAQGVMSEGEFAIEYCQGELFRRNLVHGECPCPSLHILYHQLCCRFTGLISPSITYIASVRVLKLDSINISFVTSYILQFMYKLTFPPCDAQLRPLRAPCLFPQHCAAGPLQIVFQRCCNLRALRCYRSYTSPMHELARRGQCGLSSHSSWLGQVMTSLINTI